MADINTEVTIDAILTAAKTQIAAAFPAFRTVDVHRDSEERVPAPACMIELTEIEPQPDQDAGTGQLPAMLRFEARIVMQHRDASTALEIRNAAASLACWLNLRRWGPTARGDAIRVIACEPDEYKPAQPGQKVWRVEWVQLALLGESVWIGPDSGYTATPHDVYVGVSPDIGPANIDDYAQIVDGEPAA